MSPARIYGGQAAMTVNVLYVLRGARCKSCGATVNLARDWLGMAWRDARGRHHCEALAKAA